MLRFIFLALAAVLISPTFASAKPVRMYCEISKSGGWVANQMFFEYDAAAGKARVVDGIILHFEGSPIPAQIGENTAKKITFKWTVIMTNQSGQTTKMAYRAAILRNTNKVLIHAQPHGYRNNFTARGRCQPTQHPLPTT